MASRVKHSAFKGSVKQTLNVPESQQLAVPKARHEYQLIPSVSTPNWGAQHNYLIQDRPVELNDSMIYSVFNLGPIGGLTVTNSGTAAYVDARFFVTRVEIVCGGVILDTIYPLPNFIAGHLLPTNDSDVLNYDTAAGLYNSHTTRATKSAGTSNWYLPLHLSPFCTSRFPLLYPTSNLEIRVYQDLLTNCYTLTSGSTATGTPTGAVNSASLLIKYSKLSTAEAEMKRTLNTRYPLSYVFPETRRMVFSVNSGVTQVTLPLTNIVGYIPCFFFTVFNTTSPTADQNWTFQSISSYAILDTASTNIVGGQPIVDAQSRYLLGLDYFDTSYTNGNPLYFYSFALNPKSVLKEGHQLGGYSFKGSESLQITFSSALSSAVQISFFAWAYSALHLRPEGITKIGLEEA